jgi:hypothetical protein
MNPRPSSSRHPHSPFRWWVAVVAALVLLLASVAAGAVLGWF